VTQGRIGTLILHSIPGQAEAKGQIKEFSLPKWNYTVPKIFSKLFPSASQTIPWRIVFENQGNKHINLESQVEIFDFRNKLVFASQPKRITVLPQTERELKDQWLEPAWIGRFTAISKVSFLDENDNLKTETKSVVFYIIPLQLLLTLGLSLGIILLISLIIYRLVKKRKKKKQKLCPQCGKLISPKAVFCSYCGLKVKNKRAKCSKRK